MKEKHWATLITSLIGIGVVSYFAEVVHKNENWGALGVATAMGIELMIMLIVGIVLLGDKKTKPIGQGILLGAGITFLIGSGISFMA